MRSFRWMLPALLALAIGLSAAPARGQAPSAAQEAVDAVEKALGTGQEKGESGETKAEEGGPADGENSGEAWRADETTPRGVMELYLQACRKGDFGKASEYLELDRLVAEQGGEEAASLAWRLNVVLDQKLWIDLEELSPRPEGNQDDGSPRRDRVGVIESERGKVPVILERMATDAGIEVWRISSATVARVPMLYEQYGYGPLGEHLPEIFFTTSLFQIQLWQWIGIALLATIVYLPAALVVWLLYLLIRPAVRRTRTEVDDRILQAAVGPVRAVLALTGFSALSLLLRLAMPAQSLVNQAVKAALTVAVVWLAMRLIDVFLEASRRRLLREGRQSAVAVLPMGRRALKVAVLFLAAISIMQVFGFNVTGLLASLGLGGLAVALAAQKSLENMFAGLSLISDQPVRVGDFCRFGDQVGTVEDIGLRSTKVRTLDRTVMAVPNSQFAEMHLDNYAKRDYIRFHHILGLRYETGADQMRQVLIELRRMLVSHPQVSLEPFWRVRFIGFGDYSLKVEMFAYARTTDYGTYRAIEEDLLLRIMDIVEGCGSAMAFPSQTTYLGRDGGLDQERTQEAMERVRKLRDSSELPFPNFPDKAIGEMKDSLSYPPEGAPRAES